MLCLGLYSNGVIWLKCPWYRCMESIPYLLSYHIQIFSQDFKVQGIFGWTGRHCKANMSSSNGDTTMTNNPKSRQYTCCMFKEMIHRVSGWTSLWKTEVSEYFELPRNSPSSSSSSPELLLFFVFTLLVKAQFLLVMFIWLGLSVVSLRFWSCVWVRFTSPSFWFCLSLFFFLLVWNLRFCFHQNYLLGLYSWRNKVGLRFIFLDILFTF